MKTGTVQWFNARKGYGFLAPVDGGFNVRVDISAVERAGLLGLKEGQEIGFEIVVDERTGESFAANLKTLPNAPASLNNNPSVPGPKSSSWWKASWFGGSPRRA
jgi:cold shock protein